MKNKFIFLTVYDRDHTLKKSLDALSKLKNIEQFQILIVYQDYFPKVKEVIDSVNWTKLHLIHTLGKGKTPVQNINYNRIIGYNKIFNELNGDLVLGIEDDAILGYDALFFAEKMNNKYSSDKRFMGINLGSQMKFSKRHLYDYNLYKCGIFGQGWALNKQIWENILKIKILDDHTNMGLDNLLEPYARSGFVVVPYCSRYIDLGWNGTHAKGSPEEGYFYRIKKSWIGIDSFELKTYIRNKSFRFFWEPKCYCYNIFNNFVFDIKCPLDRLRVKLNLNIRNRIRTFFQKGIF